MTEQHDDQEPGGFLDSGGAFLDDGPPPPPTPEPEAPETDVAEDRP